MSFLKFSTVKGVKLLFTLLFLFSANITPAQVTSYSWYYRVYFKDKGENIIENYAPENLLSDKAISRRQKAEIPVPDFRDIPVFNEYLDHISALGLKLHCTSKWMNTALFKSKASIDINTLLYLPFVIDVKTVKTPGSKSYNDKLDFQTEQADVPPFDRPITMINGYPLHNSGYDGKGILIAVLDAGFTYADQIPALDELKSRKGIKATYNFPEKSEYVYGFHSHGTAVLSVLAGKLPWLIEGTAPGADYLLLRTEDGSSEFPCEEDFWAAGAEFADSAGADIISSSLGYFNFDNPDLNYKLSDLDGNTAFVTKAADIAASKGILVVNSAGNERDNSWKRIIFPADGDSVVAVGAVDGNNLISSFSSAGPSFDGRIKPDIATMGVNVVVQTTKESIGRSSGTSFSCPVLSGMAACLMQAVPKALNIDIIKALHSSADRYSTPDSLYGYGIPNMVYALTTLQDTYVKTPDEESVAVPNPTTGDFEIIFREPPKTLTVEIISMSGKIIYKKEISDYAGRTIRITELRNREQGIYFVRIKNAAGTCVHKIIKLRN